MDTRLNRRRSRHLAGRLACLVLGATDSGSTTCSSHQQRQQCEMTARIPLLPSAVAFVPPSPSTIHVKAISNHRRRTVPLVLKDPTDVVGPTTGGDDDGYPPENAHNNSGGPENSAYASSTNNALGSSISSDGAVVPIGPLIELEHPDAHLNREFTNDFILHEGFLNSGSGGGSGPNSLAETAAALEEETCLEGSEPTLGGDDLDPYLVEHGAAEQLFIETVVRREGSNHIVRIEGIAPLTLEDDDEEEETVNVAAAADGQTSSTSTHYQIPTLPQIIQFALPATAIYLCDPLLSLIDTASVGLLAKSTAHQAALSPAIAVVNYSALLLAFLFVGATNFVAQAAAKVGGGADASGVDVGSDDMDGKEDNNNSVAQILLSTLQISLHTGTILGLLLFALAPQLISLLAGRTSSLPPAVYQPAVQYVRIRALGFPFAAVLGSAQAACLGLKDTTTPLLVLGAAAILNVVGDLSLVGVTSSKWLFGAAGAAWATTIGQMAAVGLFLRLLKAKKPGDKEDDDTVGAAASDVGGSGRLSLTRLFSRRRADGGADMTTADLPSGTAGSGADTNGGAISARGFLAEHNFEPHHILRLPPRSTVKQFLPYVVPVTTTSVGRVSLFLSMAHVVSSCMGVVGMAAQTIALGIFDALCPLSQSLTLAAQAFVPGALEEQDRLRRAVRREEVEAAGSGGSGAEPERKKKSRDVLAQFSRQFLKAGGAFGLFTALCATSIPFVSGLMTTDAAVVAQITAVMPHLAAIFALHGLVMSAEGVLLGKEDVNFLGCMYGAFFFIMPAWMMRVKHGALHLGQAAGLGSVWSVFLMYQLMRSILWAGRAAMPTKDR